MDRAALERRLADCAGFREPRVALEQYRTPADVAAHLLHRAALNGDVAGRTVLDLGTGTGVLALGAALLDPARVVGVDRDPAALATARANEGRLAPPAPVAWLLGDATRPPLAPPGDATVVMNPPFGAQDGARGADRRFLAAARDLAAVSYSVHNAGSLDFLESYAADNGGRVTAAHRAEFDVPRQFAFHDSDRETLPVEVARIAWV